MVYYYLLMAVVSGVMSLLSFHFYVQLGSKFGRTVNKIPGPPIVPVFGNLLHFNTTSLVEINNKLRTLSKNYYPIYRLWVGIHKAVVVIRHPDDIRVVLNSSEHINKQFGYEYLYPWLRAGLLVSNGQKWHSRRKLLTPAFHYNILKKFMEITKEEGCRIIAKLSSQPKEIKQDLLSFCSESTLNIICESAMGVSLDDNKDKDTAIKYKDAVYSMGKIMFFRIIRPYIWDWMVPFIPTHHRELKTSVTNTNNFTSKIVEERRKYHQNTDYKNLNLNSICDNVYIDKSKRLAMLDLLLAAEQQRKIDDEGIKEEVSTFIFEGHDTTAIGMFFTILLLAENKECQDLARKEIEIILGPKNGHPEFEDLEHMTYLERCIKESLRLFPSVPSIARILNEDLQLKNYKIPVGTDIVMEIVDVHRDPNFWPEPERFDPDRFLPEEMAKRHNHAYIPFSAGPRNCIGQKFAMIELKSLISCILYHFYLEPIDYTRDIQLISHVVMRPNKPIFTKFMKIDRQLNI